MNIKLVGLALSSLVALAKAKSYTFNVVSILGTSYTLGVKYGTNVKPLTSSTFPLFTGTIEADDIKEYKYVALEPTTGKVIEEENITRNYSDDTSKINEVYNRTNKKDIKIPDLPQPFKPMFPMGTSKFQPFPKNVIYNIYAKCNDADYQDISDNPFFYGEKKVRNEKFVNCTFNIISPNDVFTSDGTIHVIGYGSRLYKKISFGFKFNKKFLGRKAIKIRAMAGDPSLVREKLSTEIFKAVGVPVQEGTYARLFINDDIYGLYSIVDSLSSKWIKSYVHGQDKVKIGFSYQLISSPPEGPYCDLKYKGESYEGYNSYSLDEYEESDVPEGNTNEKWKSLIDFTRMYDEWVKNYSNDTTDKGVEELKKFLNIESTLRLMAVETLLLALDNFFIVSSNSAIYYNPERKNYQFIPFDFDQTMNGARKNVMIPENYMSDCITWVNKDDGVYYDHYFTNNLLKHPKIKERYDVILAIITRDTFVADTISDYVHAVDSLISEDVQWNFETVDKLNIHSVGYVNKYTYSEYKDNLEYGTVEYEKNVKAEDIVFGIRGWVEQRGDGCRAYTANVDTSKNENISDDVDVKLYEPSYSSSDLHFSSTKYSLLLVISYLIFYFIF